MTDDILDEPLFADDPILGKFLAHYPSNRLRLLLIGGVILGVIWFIVTVALWEVEASVAGTITVIVLALATLIVGWFMAHLWNREVVLYERGFSYWEGSIQASIRFADINTIRQRGERLTYFGGLLTRNTYRLILITNEDEIITLTSLYSHLDQLSLSLELAITQAMQNKLLKQFDAGEHVPFGENLALSAQGLHAKNQLLPWEEFYGYQIQKGMLIIETIHHQEWLRVRLADIDNLRLLVNTLREPQINHGK